MNNKIIETDLTKTDPGPGSRATFHRKLERIELGGKTSGGATFRLAAQVFAGSPQSSAMTTLMLVVAACLMTGVAYAIGVPTMTALITGLCAPIGIFALVRVISGHWTK